MPGVLRRQRGLDERVDAAAIGRWALGCARELRPQLVYERHTLFGGVGALLRRKLGVPWFLEVNAPLSWEAAWFEGAGARPGWLRRELRTLQAADRLIVVSQALVDWLVESGIPAERIDLVPNGVSALGGPPRPPSSEGPFRLGYEGSFKPWQGLSTALPEVAALAASLAPRPLVIEAWGDGPDRIAFEEAARQLGLRVELKGWGRPDRRSWSAAWSPQAAWPPPGPSLEGPVPARYFCPLKEAEARAAGLCILTGGELRPPGALPRTWASIAKSILRAAELEPRPQRGKIPPLHERSGTDSAPSTRA